MSSLRAFRCEICGVVTTNPLYWFLVECGSPRLTVLRWELDSAGKPDARHLCGEAHVQVYMSRWFESVFHRPGLITRQ